MIWLLLLLTLGLGAALYLLGYVLGEGRTAQEVAKVRLEAGRASRQLSDLVRDSFTAITREAERQRRRP